MNKIDWKKTGKKANVVAGLFGIAAAIATAVAAIGTTKEAVDNYTTEYPKQKKLEVKGD